MKFSQGKGHKVVSSTTADTVAKVRDYLIDPESRSVIALRLRKSDEGEYVRWADLSAFGSDAVTVTDATSFTDSGQDLEALSSKAARVVGKRVLTSGGDELGEVGDVEFDPESGAVISLLLKKAGEVDGRRLLGVGSYAVVVAATS